jgi:hypothetical protein
VLVFTIPVHSPWPSHLPTLVSGPDSLQLFGPHRVKPENNPDDATKMIQPTTPPRWRLTLGLRSKPTPFSPSLKDPNTQPSVTSPNSSYTNQLQCPPKEWVPAKTTEAPVQPKPTEVTRVNHPRGHPRQYKMFRATPSFTKSMYKIGTRNPKKTKPQ